jgi:phage repressor protein C with HTH and peptisase S24 domain
METETKNPIHERLREAIEGKFPSFQAAAVAAKLDRNYFTKLFSRKESVPGGNSLNQIAVALGVDTSWILTGSTKMAENSPELKAPSFPYRSTMPLDVPVRGTAAGSHLRGAFQLDSDIVDYVRRPETLATAKDIYALYVEGSSMEPRYFPGDLVYINPNKPPRSGDVIVVQSKYHDEHQIEATIGVYVKKIDGHIIIQKYNPPAEVKIKCNEATIIHRVLTVNEIYGV